MSIGDALLMPALGEHYAPPSRPVVGGSSPLPILGASAILWSKADTNTIDATPSISRIYDLSTGSLGSAKDFVFNQGGVNPTNFGLGPHGYYAAGDGSNDHLLSTWPTALASGTRPYFWCVLRTPGSTKAPISFGYTGGGWLVYMVEDTPQFRISQWSADGQDDIYGAARDTNLHLHEIAWPNSTADRYVVDGVGYAGTKTGGTDKLFNFIGLWSLLFVGSFSTAEFYELLIADSQPSTAQKLAIRNYFRDRYPTLSIA
jgi:hypothetical protein